MLPGIQLSLRAALSAALSVALADALRLPFPLYAMIAAVIVTDLSASQTRRLGFPRLVGTVIGGALGATLSAWLGSGPAAVAVGIAVAMTLSYALHIPVAARLAGYVCAIVLLERQDAPWSYALARLIETMLGVSCSMFVGCIPKLLRADHAA